ncbi:MAG: hypothetical protein U0787_04805 [Polyangia bacterium]
MRHFTLAGDLHHYRRRHTSGELALHPPGNREAQKSCMPPEFRPIKASPQGVVAHFYIRPMKN